MKVIFKKKISLYRAILTLLNKLDDESSTSRYHSIVMYGDGSGSIVKSVEMGERVLSFSDLKSDLKNELRIGLEQ